MWFHLISYNSSLTSQNSMNIKIISLDSISSKNVFLWEIPSEHMPRGCVGSRFKKAIYISYLCFWLHERNNQTLRETRKKLVLKGNPRYFGDLSIANQVQNEWVKTLIHTILLNLFNNKATRGINNYVWRVEGSWQMLDE